MREIIVHELTQATQELVREFARFLPRLMVMLIVEQGKTIDTQRYLIRSLFSDSSQLTALRNGVIQKHNNEAQAKARTQAAPSAIPRAA